MVVLRILLASLALGGCVKVPPYVGPVSPNPTPSPEPSTELSTHSATISGTVHDRNTDETLEGALVILQSSALVGARETTTNARGLYRFGDLPAGTYVIQVLFAQADTSKVTTLPEGSSRPSRCSRSTSRRLACSGSLPRRSSTDLG